MLTGFRGKSRTHGRSGFWLTGLLLCLSLLLNLSTLVVQELYWSPSDQYLDAPTTSHPVATHRAGEWNTHEKKSERPNDSTSPFQAIHDGVTGVLASLEKSPWNDAPLCINNRSRLAPFPPRSPPA